MIAIRKRIIATEFVMILNLFSGVAAASYVDERLFWLGFGVVVLAGSYLATLRCPRCGFGVFKRRKRFAGATWTYGQGFPLPRNCFRCNFDFSSDDRPDPVRWRDDTLSRD